MPFFLNMWRLISTKVTINDNLPTDFRNDNFQPIPINTLLANFRRLFGHFSPLFDEVQPNYVQIRAQLNMFLQFFWKKSNFSWLFTDTVLKSLKSFFFWKCLENFSIFLVIGTTDSKSTKNSL